DAGNADAGHAGNADAGNADAGHAGNAGHAHAGNAGAGHADRFHPRPHYDPRPDSAGRNGKSKRGCAINIACPARSEYRSGAVDQQGGHRVTHYTDCNECASGPGGAQDPCPAVRAQHPRCSHQQHGSTEEVAGGADQASGAFDPTHGTRTRDAIGSRHGGSRYFHCIQDAVGLIRAERRAERRRSGAGPGRVMKPSPYGVPGPPSLGRAQTRSSARCSERQS
ncbi:MAG: hypothetical protein JWO34_2711, partial [Arthrobacter sp.]|nr:hypothetical protein [Arthrobacter sp.]